MRFFEKFLDIGGKRRTPDTKKSQFPTECL